MTEGHAILDIVMGVLLRSNMVGLNLWEGVWIELIISF